MKIKLFYLLVFFTISGSLYAQERRHKPHHVHHGGIVHHRHTTRNVRGHHFNHHTLGHNWEARHKQWAISHQQWNNNRWHRYWWHSRWWGPGWSLYPYYWLTDRLAFDLGLASLAEEGNWELMYLRLNRRITSLQQDIKHARRRNDQRLITNLEQQIDVLESYIQDMDIYRATRISHKRSELHNKNNIDKDVVITF